MGSKRIIVGISGASGTIYGIRLLEAVRGHVETHLLVTARAERTVAEETSYTLEQIKSLASYVHDDDDLAAPISSGSFSTDGMVVIPCSVKSLSAVVNSYADRLLVRAADVTLKERRRLVLAVRETPLHIGHIRLMEAASEMGAIIFPPVPCFYHRPATIEDLIAQTVGRILDLFGIEHTLSQHWDGGSGPTLHDQTPEEGSV